MNTGAEKVRWDLSVMYSGVDDPQIDADVASLINMAKEFNSQYKGKLKEKLSQAMHDFIEMSMLQNKLNFLYLSLAIDVADPKLKSKVAEVEKILSLEMGETMTFFNIELVSLSDDNLNTHYLKDPVVAKHRPWIEQARVFKPHILIEPVEGALAKRSPFGPSAWSEFFDELESDLSFIHKGEKKNMTEMLHILTESKNADERFEVMTKVNEGFKGHFGKYSAQTLYMVTGSNSTEDKERKYRHPMEGRNKSNRVSDEIVDALHKAVTCVATPYTKRYYKLKAEHLGFKTLRWSDRNAPMPFLDTSLVPFDRALAMVLDAYRSFSPTLANLVEDMVAQKRIDAPAGQGRRSGAFNSSAVLPGNTSVSYTFLNYLGSGRDVTTLAHELGHGVHGMLAGKTQGVLMQFPPIAYCETASKFGEGVTFEFLKKKMIEKGDKKSLLALIMSKIDDSMNTVVRQIGFSNFERRIHGMNETYTTWGDAKKNSPEELCQIWLTTAKELYGEDGEVFTFENSEYLWAYINHFHNPFYVYGYAFGQLLTESLLASRDKVGDKFEELYLDLLSSGSTRDAADLLKPFGFDPNHEEFWANGIRNGLGKLVEEAESLSVEMGIKI